jgi:phosphate transport system substrate-binding protein
MNFIFSILFISSITAIAQDVVHINGSTTVNPVVTEAAEILRKEKGIQIQVDTQGGSSGGINALAEGRAEIAMSSRPLNEQDHAKFKSINFISHQIGEDAVALIVSKDVWDGGVKSITKDQMKMIYERQITNWKQVGGPDQRIAFFNKEPGRGTWEVFANWLYGKADLAPSVAHPEVGANEETRTKVASSKGALSQLSSSWVDGKSIFSLGIQNANGEVSFPTAEHIAKHEYPLTRSLWVITNGAPKGNSLVLLDFLKSEKGQELVRKNGYLSLRELKQP